MAAQTLREAMTSAIRYCEPRRFIYNLDTLTSVDSQVGDPFSATVVDKGDYQNARVYGHVAQIDLSGRIKGHTSMMLRFDRLVMPDGRRAPIHAEIVELYHAP